VIAAEHALDRAWADYALGRYKPARDALAALERSTTGLDAAGLAATLATLAAAVESRIGEPTAARAKLERALAATAKAHATALEYVVWMRLLRHELFAGQPARAIEWAPFARAAASRAGLDGAELDGILGEALRDAGDLAAARAYLGRALGSRDPLRGDQRAIIEMNMGSVELASHEPDRAEAAFQRAFDLARRQLGDEHPSLAIYRDKLAEADRARGRFDTALAHHDASIALRTSAYGDADRSIATARFHRAETLLAAGRLDDAHADARAARAIRAAVYGETSPRLGELDMLLGDVEAARGNKAAAATLHAQAVRLDPRLVR
jgi:tetratricopeptide (TPR) repeat protein